MNISKGNLNTFKIELDNVLGIFKNNINKIKGNIEIFNYIKINYLNKNLPISKLSHLSYDEKNNIIITPIETNLLKLIEKNLRSQNLDYSIINTGKNLILLNQYMNKEKKCKLIKLLKSESESNKIIIRNIRRKFLNNIKKFNILNIKSEKIKFESQVNKITNEYINIIDTLFEEKIKNL